MLRNLQIFTYKGDKANSKSIALSVFKLVSDINECEEGIHNCVTDDKCINSNGSYRCTGKTQVTMSEMTQLCFTAVKRDARAQLPLNFSKQNN